MIIKYDKNVIAKAPELFEYEQKYHVEKIVNYFINSKYRTAVNLKSWIKEQVEVLHSSVWKILDQIPTKDTYDMQMIEILWWVNHNIRYVRDLNSPWKMNEHWNTAEETIRVKEGDCEDGAILMYVLARAKGVPASRLSIACGDVTDPGNNLRTIGHAFLLYKPDEYPLNWTILDWCYYYSGKYVSIRNKFTIIGKTFYEYTKFHLGGWAAKQSNYQNMWFCFNEDKSYTRLRGKNE